MAISDYKTHKYRLKSEKCRLFIYNERKNKLLFQLSFITFNCMHCFSLTKCRWVQILSIQIGSRTAYIKSREDVRMSVPSFMRLIGSNNQPFKCVPLSWQSTGLSGAGIYSAHCSIFYCHCRICVLAFGQREEMI